MRLRAKISAIGGYLPSQVLSNRDLESMVDTSDDWIVKRTGIRERRIEGEQSKPSSYLATESVKDLLNTYGSDLSDVGLVICGTNTPDMIFPATATKVAHDVGALRAGCFDLQAACAGFVYALAIGSQCIASGVYQKVLVLGVDKMSSCVDYGNRKTCILFGDAAGSVLLEPEPSGKTGVIDSILYSDGSKQSHLCIPAGGSLRPTTQETLNDKGHFIYQDGSIVFKEAVNKMSEVCQEMMDRHHLLTHLTHLINSLFEHN